MSLRAAQGTFPTLAHRKGVWRMTSGDYSRSSLESRREAARSDHRPRLLMRLEL